MASPPVYVERLDSYFPPDGGAEFYAEIGRIVTLWGALDNNLDLALLHINRAERNPDLYTDRLRTHKHRRTALRNWLRNDPQIAHVRNDGEIIVLAAARIQTYRDVFAHGRFLEFKRGDPPKIVFSTIPIRSRKKRAHSYFFDIASSPNFHRLSEIAVCIPCARSWGSGGRVNAF